MTIRDKAQSRVNTWDKLKAHEDTIMYDWPEGDEHWEWVCKAPIAEIVDWAETIEKDTDTSWELVKTFGK